MASFTNSSLLLIALALSACAGGGDVPAEQGVRTFMAGIFDRPDSPLSVPSVVLVGDYALAGWIQSGHGGRTLLKRSAEGWDFVVCGGDELASPVGLREVGLPAEFIEMALVRMAQTEAGLTAEERRLLGDFKGVMKMEGLRHPSPKK